MPDTMTSQPNTITSPAKKDITARHYDIADHGHDYGYDTQVSSSLFPPALSRRLLLVEDLVDSLKLAGGMWLMTYIGAVFNGITVLILADIICFTSPLVYQKYKTQIDRRVELARSKLKETVDRLQDMLPGSIKRTKAA
ncbi:unnamed protein product [Boreogadus saida]